MNEQEILTEMLLLWTVFINIFAVLLTCMDKHRACKRNVRRIPEKTLFTAALLGGAVGMYAAMRLVRHKTLHKRFMIGLPVIIAVQAGIVIAILYFRVRCNVMH